MPYTPFTLDEVRHILRESELNDGHAGERHSKATNAFLVERQMRGTPIATAFPDFKQMIAAGLALLNDPASDAALEEFRVDRSYNQPNAKGNKKRLTLSHQLAIPIRMRYAIGGTVHTFPCRHLRMVIEKDTGRPHCRFIHVVTFFGEMG